MAGCTKRQDAPPATDEDALGADSTKFVQMPFGLAMKYHMRAKKMTMLQPENQRLKWLEAQDTADRAMWVELYRNGTDTLGVVIQNVM